MYLLNACDAISPNGLSRICTHAVVGETNHHLFEVSWLVTSYAHAQLKSITLFSHRKMYSVVGTYYGKKQVSIHKTNIIWRNGCHKKNEKNFGHMKIKCIGFTKKISKTLLFVGFSYKHHIHDSEINSRNSKNWDWKFFYIMMFCRDQGSEG